MNCVKKNALFCHLGIYNAFSTKKKFELRIPKEKKKRDQRTFKNLQSCRKILAIKEKHFFKES